MAETKKSFWTYGILLALLAIVIACIATIFIASHYPVYEDEFYFDSYQNVENNFNRIQKQQKKFNQFFKIEFQNDKVAFLGKRRISNYEVGLDSYKADFKISALQNFNPNDLQLQVLLTRPFTKEFDKKLQGQIKNGILSIVLPKLEEGRWQLKIKLSLDEETVGFFIYELNAR